MPYKCEKLKIPESKDRRRKLTSEDKDNIREMYQTKEYSQRALAAIFNVSRRTIQFTISPEKRIENYQQRVANGGSMQYYNKESHTISIRECRRYKNELYKQGLLK